MYSTATLREILAFRELQEKYPDYGIGRSLIGIRWRWYAYRRAGSGPHTLITDDLTELVTELTSQRSRP
jgi:hypothetical protein